MDVKDFTATGCSLSSAYLTSNNCPHMPLNPGIYGHLPPAASLNVPGWI